MAAAVACVEDEKHVGRRTSIDCTNPDQKLEGAEGNFEEFEGLMRKEVGIE